MSSIEPGLANTMDARPQSACGAGATTRSVKRLIARQAVLTDQCNDMDKSTDTFDVMVRLGPEPTVVLAIDDAEARIRVATLMNNLSVEVRQIDASRETLSVPVGRPVILMTDNLDVVRGAHADRLQPNMQCLFLWSHTGVKLEEAMLAGADDGISLDAGCEAFRARLAAASRYAHLEASFRILLRENRELSTIDELTKVASRRFFARHYPLEVDRARRYRRSMALIMCDIDHFKRINDTFGHLAGDEVLREFSLRLQQTLRQGCDWMARVGGEEFAIVLPDAQIDLAERMALRLARKTRNKAFNAGGTSIAATASFGVCELSAAMAQKPGVTKRLLEAADAALYRSKKEGRDRVTVMSLKESMSRARAAI